MERTASDLASHRDYLALYTLLHKLVGQYLYKLKAQASSALTSAAPDLARVRKMVRQLGSTFTLC